MSAEGIAALIVAFGGLVGGLFAGFRSLRSDKFKQEVEAGAALLSGYTGMVAALRTELDRVKEAHAEEKAAWVEERKGLHVEIDQLRAEVYAMQRRLAVRDEDAEVQRRAALRDEPRR